MEDSVREVAIIGGGPGGLTSGLYLCRSQVDAVLLDRELTGGQAIMSPLIENYPGFPDGIEGPELVNRMKEQAERFDLEIKTFSEVRSLEVQGTLKKLALDKQEIKALSVVVASGRSPRKLGVPGEEEFTGRGVSYCATCDGPLFKEREVMVVGGGDAAVEEALHLTRFAGKVILVHRRDELRASSYLKERAAADPKLEFLWNTEVEKIEGDQTVEAVEVVNNRDQRRSRIPVSGVFFYVGNVPNSGFLPDDAELDDGGYIVTDENLETSIPGVFAVGDVRSHRFRQILIAAAEGALASSSVQRYLETIGARAAYAGGPG